MNSRTGVLEQPRPEVVLMHIQASENSSRNSLAGI